MLGDQKKWFWNHFDENIKLNYLALLKGLTNHKIISPYLSNSFHSTQKNACEFYVRIAKALLSQKKLENDISMVYSNDESAFLVHSINLNNYFSKVSFNSIYESFDEVYLSKYSSKEYDISDDFSFLLGNFVRHYKEGIISNSDNKRLHILTSVIERFCYRKDNVEISIFKSKSYVKINNDILIEKLKYYYTHWEELERK